MRLDAGASPIPLKGKHMEWLTSPEIWVAFFTLTALEIVLDRKSVV